MTNFAGPGSLSVFIRSNTHTTSGAVRLALKAEQFTVQVSKSPIQIGAPGGTVILEDLGYLKPSITISGIIDTIGGDTSNTTITGTSKDDQDTNVKGMESITFNSQTYHIPYKNYLESFLLRYESSGNELQVEVGDATTPQALAGAFSTGGAVYKVLVQQLQFSLAPSTEDRWLYTIGFAAGTREDMVF